MVMKADGRTREEWDEIIARVEASIGELTGWAPLSSSEPHWGEPVVVGHTIGRTPAYGPEHLYAVAWLALAPGGKMGWFTDANGAQKPLHWLPTHYRPLPLPPPPTVEVVALFRDTLAAAFASLEGK